MAKQNNWGEIGGMFFFFSTNSEFSEKKRKQKKKEERRRKNVTFCLVSMATCTRRKINSASAGRGSN